MTFTGAQPHNMLVRYLAASDAFVFPSELNEAAPLAPLQALACGSPVIASSVGSVPELIGPKNECGLLVPPGQPLALAAAMQRMLEDAGLRKRLRVAGLRVSMTSTRSSGWSTARGRFTRLACRRHALTQGAS